MVLLDDGRFAETETEKLHWVKSKGRISQYTNTVVGEGHFYL